MSLKVGNKVRESGPTSYLGNLQKWGEKHPLGEWALSKILLIIDGVVLFDYL